MPCEIKEDEEHENLRPFKSYSRSFQSEWFTWSVHFIWLICFGGTFRAIIFESEHNSFNAPLRAIQMKFPFDLSLNGRLQFKCHMIHKKYQVLFKQKLCRWP